MLKTFSHFIVNVCLHERVSNKILNYIAIGLPFIAMSSCLNSYFTSVRKAYKTAITQVFELSIKIIVTVVLLTTSISRGVEAICISLILADVISEIASFSLIYIFYIIDRNKRKLPKINSFGNFKKIIKLAFPVGITSYVRSFLSTIKQFLIPLRLELSGLSCSLAISYYGTINGMALPILMFPNVFIGSFSGLLVPEFSSYLAKNNKTSIYFIANKIFYLTSMFSVLISSIFILFSNEISYFVYQNIEVGKWLKILAPLIFFMYMDNVIDGVLKGLNKQFWVMCANIIDLVSTILFIYFLLPILGITGYIITFFISELLNFTISFYQLYKVTNLKFDILNWIIKPLLSSAISMFLLQVLNIFNGLNIYQVIFKSFIFITFYFTILLIIMPKVFSSFYFSKNLK